MAGIGEREGGFGEGSYEARISQNMRRRSAWLLVLHVKNSDAQHNSLDLLIQTTMLDS